VRDGSFHRATCLGLAGLLAGRCLRRMRRELLIASAESRLTLSRAEPTTNTPPGESAAEPPRRSPGASGFSATGSMATARDGQSTATLLSDGRV